ncbi:hypothetical protein AXG93_150s1170 [Marchantia polymorpha subsp. ruderalis]|uniref:Uncharacterized protein n=1 Tax=Marchantia polymorpha subsp. ruderalis TaxID=1480154 RepID=A0A176WDC7_MARPO|nr:hypothetical protein AXG93_150s1170 [Marchantia polymorpha subsp. ruderalis]
MSPAFGKKQVSSEEKDSFGSSVFGIVDPEVEKRSSAKEPKKVVSTFPDFLRNSVVPLLKYLDAKREKYGVLEEAKYYVHLLRNRTRSKIAASTKNAENVAGVAGECVVATATLEEREEQLWTKEMECEALWRELVKEKELRKEELRNEGLRREFVTMNKVTMDLRERIEACNIAHMLES